MRAKLGIAIPLVLVTVAVGVLSTTAASGQNALNFVIGPGKLSVVDLGHNGLRLGDRISARSPLLDGSQSERVGTAYLQCLVHERIIDPDKGLWNCNYVLELTDGDILLQGLDPRGPGEYEVAVIGGTGAYAGARGDATFTDVGHDADNYTSMAIRLKG
jgi:hypothetical protein